MLPSMSLRLASLLGVLGCGALAAEPVEVMSSEPVAQAGRPRVELTLYPVRAQLNAALTAHLGASGTVHLRVSDFFAFQISGGYDFLTGVTPFNDELVAKFRSERQRIEALLWTWTAIGGVEFTPGLGQLQFGDGGVRFGFFLNAGLGAGGSRHELAPATATSPAVSSDTGVRFLGALGAGLRVDLTRAVSLRLEVRDVMASSRVSSVNGCSAADLTELSRSLTLGRQGPVSSGCRDRSFFSAGRSTLPSAQALTAADATLLHTVTAAFGMSVIF
jgi:hypothetical protein